MKKTLKTIQVIAKIFQVLFTIGFVVSIIGSALSLLAISALAAFSGITVNGETLYQLLQNEIHIPVGMIYSMLVVAAISCGASIAVNAVYCAYFRQEMKDGTPFTLAGSKKLCTAGICGLAIPVGSAIVCSVAIQVIQLLFRYDYTVSASNVSLSLTGGIMTLIIALLCKYGAQVAESRKDDAADCSTCAIPVVATAENSHETVTPAEENTENSAIDENGNTGTEVQKPDENVEKND